MKGLEDIAEHCDYAARLEAIKSDFKKYSRQALAASVLALSASAYLLWNENYLASLPFLFVAAEFSEIYRDARRGCA